MNYYRRYVGDYLRDTARLSMLEHGAYTLLLDYCYADEQPLPLDKNELYTMVRAMTPADRNAVDRILGKFFSLEDDGYHQKRVDHEIAVSKQARVNGKKGGRGGTGSPTGSGTGTITGFDTETETDYLTGTDTGDDTEQGAGLVHPPTTNHHPPTTTLQPPTKKTKTKAKKANGHDFPLPDWIPRDQWDAWIEAREKRRNAPTEWAMKLAVIKLEHLKAEGHSVAHILANSAFHGWAGLFVPKEH